MNRTYESLLIHALSTRPAGVIGRNYVGSEKEKCRKWTILNVKRLNERERNRSMLERKESGRCGEAMNDKEYITWKRFRNLYGRGIKGKYGSI